MIRWLLIFAAAAYVLTESLDLWLVFGDWADPYTWLIWLSPVPIVMEESPC